MTKTQKKRGNRLYIERYESHDNLRMAMTFGESAIYDALVIGRTGNTLGYSQQDWRDEGR